MAQINSKKKMRPKDIIEFGWDGNSKKETPEITDEDRERMRKKLSETEKQLNNGKK